MGFLSTYFDICLCHELATSTSDPTKTKLRDYSYKQTHEPMLILDFKKAVRLNAEECCTLPADSKELPYGTILYNVHLLKTCAP